MDPAVDAEALGPALNRGFGSLSEVERQLVEAVVFRTNSAAMEFRDHVLNSLPRGQAANERFKLLRQKWPNGFCRLTVANEGPRTANGVAVFVPEAQHFNSERQGTLESEKLFKDGVELGNLGGGDSVQLTVWTSSFSVVENGGIRIRHEGDLGEVSLKKTVAPFEAFWWLPWWLRYPLLGFSLLGVCYVYVYLYARWLWMQQHTRLAAPHNQATGPSGEPARSDGPAHGNSGEPPP